MTDFDARQQKGRKLIKDLIDNGNYTFSFPDKEYITTENSCTCPDHAYRQYICKHMWAVRFKNSATDDQTLLDNTDKIKVMKIDFRNNNNRMNIYDCVDKYNDIIDIAEKMFIITRDGSDYILVE